MGGFGGFPDRTTVPSHWSRLQQLVRAWPNLVLVAFLPEFQWSPDDH